MSRGLVLTGGGARAAYQVGVLKGIASILPRSVYNPFRLFAAPVLALLMRYLLLVALGHFACAPKNSKVFGIICVLPTCTVPTSLESPLMRFM